MHGTHLRDLQQSGSLRCCQISTKLQRPLNTIEPRGVRLALRAVDGMNPRMGETNGHRLQRPAFSSRVQRDRHRRATAQRREQELVWSGTGVHAAVRNRFIRDETMRPRRNLLCESEARPSNDHFRFVRYVVGGHRRVSFAAATFRISRSPAACPSPSFTWLSPSMSSTARYLDTLSGNE